MQSRVLAAALQVLERNPATLILTPWFQSQQGGRKVSRVCIRPLELLTGEPVQTEASVTVSSPTSANKQLFVLLIELNERSPCGQR